MPHLLSFMPSPSTVAVPCASEGVQGEATRTSTEARQNQEAKRPRAGVNSRYRTRCERTVAVSLCALIFLVAMLGPTVIVIPLALNGQMAHEPGWRTAIAMGGHGRGATGSATRVDSTTWPSPGHKLQLNASSFTVNDFECLEIVVDRRRLWSSERVHCELRKDGNYDWVVEHFDDPSCTRPDSKNPGVRHPAVGCYYYSAYNQSYNDACQPNRTVTISAFYGAGCVDPMPVTATNLQPQRQARRV